MLHGLCFGEEAGARNLVFFRVKWLQPAMKGTSCVRRLRLRSFGSFYVFCNNGASCVCSSMRFLKPWLQIALEWLRQGCLMPRPACIILLSFAAEDRKSYWSGCIQAARVMYQQIFSILALLIFLLKFLVKSASKSSFCRFGVEIRFWSCNFRRHCT